MNKHYRDSASRYADIGAINGHEEQCGLEERQEDKLSHARIWLLILYPPRANGVNGMI